jgi:hypothetical protein
MSYMKWAAHIRDNVKQLHANGMLGVLAARTSIPEYRLRDWATMPTIDNLSHTEMSAIERVLDAIPKDKKPGGAFDPHAAEQCGCQSCEDDNVSFGPAD